MAAMSIATIDVDAFIDESPVSGFQKKVILLCATLVFLDGFDVQIMGFVAPALIKAWHLAPSELGPVFSSGLVGVMFGALLIAPLADRFGRRPVIMASAMIFGIFSLATAFAADIDSLLILRLLTGLGLGGCLPNAIALTSEYSPKRKRALLVMLMFSGFTLGSLFGGLISAQLLPLLGWQSVFVVGGILPIAATALLWFGLPESIRFLLLRPENEERVSTILRKINPLMPIGPQTKFTMQVPIDQRVSMPQLFREGRARATTLLWIIFFMSLLDVYLLVNWLPTAMNSSGASVKAAVMVGVVLQLGGLIGPLPLGWLLDRKGARATLVPAYLLAAACIASIGFMAGTSLALTMLVVFGAGFGVIGGQIAANAVVSGAYPTHIRSTGVGWALGIGRIGSILGPALAGILISRQVSTEHIFLFSAVPALLAAIAAFALPKPATDVAP